MKTNSSSYIVGDDIILHRGAGHSNEPLSLYDMISIQNIYNQQLWSDAGMQDNWHQTIEGLYDDSEHADFLIAPAIDVTKLVGKVYYLFPNWYGCSGLPEKQSLDHQIYGRWNTGRFLLNEKRAHARGRLMGARMAYFEAKNCLNAEGVQWYVKVQLAGNATGPDNTAQGGAAFSRLLGCSVASEVQDTDTSFAQTKSPLWRDLDDPAVDVRRRSQSLGKLIIAGDPAVPSFIARELNQIGIEPAWRDNLLLSTEHIQFLDAADREAVVIALLSHAQKLRDASVGSLSEAALHAAIRRYSSLVSAQGAEALTNFLRPVDSVGTIQVALQCVQKIFHSGPPSEEMVLGPLAPLGARIEELAAAYRNRDWWKPGDNTALALNALHACLCLGSAKAITYVNQVIDFQDPRINRGLRRVLTSVGRMLQNSRDARQSTRAMAAEVERSKARI